MSRRWTRPIFRTMSPLGTLQFFNPARAADPDERRAKGRIGVDELACSCGDVIDLSGSGARLTTKKRWREGDCRSITLTGSDLSVTVTARCVWARREGFRRHTIGVEFQECTPEQENALNALAKRYAVRSWGAPRTANHVDFESLAPGDDDMSGDPISQPGSAADPGDTDINQAA